MKSGTWMFRLLTGVVVLGTGVSAFAQWPQWGHDPQHTGYTPGVIGQPVTTARWALTIDTTVPPAGDILIHYASPLIDEANNIFMTKKDRMDGVFHRTVMKLDAAGNLLCSYESDYVPPPSAWEPAFHPLLANGILYVPGGRGVLHRVSPDDCSEIDTVAPYEIPPDDVIRQQLLNLVFVAGVPSADDSGNVYYPIWARPGAPLGLVSQFVEVAADGTVASVNYQDLTGNPSDRPPLNAGAAIAPDGTIYIGSVRGAAIDSWLLALNPDLTFKWQASLSADPGRRAQLIDQSSSCPTVGPDGRVFFGGWSSNGISQGYLYAFSPDGQFLGSFDFGWDTTPAIYRDPDGNPTHYYLVQKYNRYAERRYFMVALDPNTMSIAGGGSCQWELVGREWCINAPAIDSTGAVYTNGEDGFLYRLTGMYPGPDGQCSPTMTRLMLDRARDAAYTPLALGPDGTIYTLNNGRLFAVGNPAGAK